MEALESLLSRVSCPVLGRPAPEGAVLDRILAAAMSAPDHGRLRPWRFLLVRGSARERLGEVFAHALDRREPGAPEPLVQKERQKPLRAPLIVVAVAEWREAAKVPEIEQIVATGAAAENLLLAAHALGFGGMWKTGWPAYDPEVKAALGLSPSDNIVGFLYLGTPPQAPPARVEPKIADFVSEWRG